MKVQVGDVVLSLKSEIDLNTAGVPFIYKSLLISDKMLD